jgi:translation initiation factor IF-2
MFDERGNKVNEAPPSTPVQVLGFEGAPRQEIFSLLLNLKG